MFAHSSSRTSIYRTPTHPHKLSIAFPISKINMPYQQGRGGGRRGGFGGGRTRGQGKESGGGRGRGAGISSKRRESGSLTEEMVLLAAKQGRELADQMAGAEAMESHIMEIEADREALQERVAELERALAVQLEQQAGTRARAIMKSVMREIESFKSR